MVNQIARKIKRKIQIKIISITCIVSILNSDYQSVAFNNEPENVSTSKYLAAQQKCELESPLSKPLVYIIEDGHCIPEIQSNIAKALFELRKKQDISDIYIEGCCGNQDFDYLRLYPLAGKREKILSDYLEKGIISGVEYFAANAVAENAVKVTGLEDRDVYIKNKATLEKISNYSQITPLINKLNVSIENLISSISQYSSLGLKQVLSSLNINNTEESVRSLMFYNGFYKKIDIIRDYPQLCDYYRNIFELSRTNFDSVMAQANQFSVRLDSLKITDELSKIIRVRLAKLYLSPIGSDDIDREIIDIICTNPSYANLKKFLVYNYALKSIDKTVVNNQVNSFLESYLISIAQNQDEKSRIKVFFALQAINKLLKLDFSYYDAMDLNCNNLFREISIESEKVSAVFAEEIKGLIDELNPIVMESLQFYDFALKRDLSLHRNFIKNYRKIKSPCVVVIGGFHSKGFMRYLEDNSIPFNLLNAKICNISNSNRKIYIQHFMTTLNPISNMAYNSSSLGTEPVLSLTGKTGPSGIWFNEIIGKHVDAIKPDKQKSSGWINALNANVKRTKNKAANIILATTLAVMLGLTAIPSTTYAQQQTPQTPVIQITQTQTQNSNLPNQPLVTTSPAANQATQQKPQNSVSSSNPSSTTSINTFDKLKTKVTDFFNYIRTELSKYQYVIDRFAKYGYYPLSFIIIAPLIYFILLKTLFKNYLNKSDKKNIRKESSKIYDQKLLDSIDILKNFIKLENNQINEYELATLYQALKLLNEKLFRIVDLNILNKVFDKLYNIANDKTKTVELRNQVVSVFTHYQLILKKERKKYESHLSEEKLQLKLFKEKVSFFQLVKYMFLYPAIQNSTIEKIDQVFDIDKDIGMLKSFNRSIRYHKMIQFLATIGFFGFVLLFTPMPNAQTAIFFLLFLSTIKTFEIILFYKLQGTTEKIAKWFEMHLGRVANFDRHLSGKATKFASYIASGEISRWYMLSIILNLVGAGMAVSCINVMLLVPYFATFFLALFLCKLMLDPEFNKIKSSHYGALINIMTKISIPAIGLLFGGLIQSFVISNLLEVLIILGSGDFIKTLSDSSVYTKEVYDILDRLVSEGHIVTQKTWKSSKEPALIGTHNIEKYEFKGITSSILNEAGIPIIDNLNFSVDKGDMVYISSSSGNGKSVFARMITFHLNNKKGEVILTTNKGNRLEVNPDNLSHKELRNIFRYLPFDNIPVGLSVEYILDNNEKKKADFVKFLKPLFEEFEKDDCKISIGKFNYSQQKRILMGLFLFLNKPSFVVLDEPFLGLDEASISLMIEFIVNYNKQNNTSVIVIDEEVPSSILPFFKYRFLFGAGNLSPLEKRIEYKEWLNKKLNNITDKSDETDKIMSTGYETKAISNSAQLHNTDNEPVSEINTGSTPQHQVSLNVDLSYFSPEDTIEPDKTKINMEFIEFARQAVLQKSEIERQNSINRLVLFVADIIDKIEIFGQEDAPNKMVLLMNYLSASDDPANTAAKIISEILKTAESQFIDKKNDNHVYADLTGYILNKKLLIGLIAGAIKTSSRLSNNYTDALNFLTEDEIEKRVNDELKKRRESVINEIAENISDKSALDFISESKLSVYEISQIVLLFKQNNIDFVFLPYVMMNFNLISFRNWLFIANDLNIPVNSTTLMLDTEDKIARYAKINDIKRKINDIAEENSPHYFRKTKDIGLNYRFFDNAA